ncbi:MAG: hypothetical protein IJS56_04145 [Bacilli bacterium]|nr:hypothetical protein [Bacilli bacterium]
MKKITLLIILALIFPITVFAHEANTPVIVDVFHNTENSDYKSFKIAINALKNDPDVKGKFEVVEHTFNDKKGKIIRKYADLNTESDFVYFVNIYYSEYFDQESIDINDTSFSTYDYDTYELKRLIQEQYGIYYISVVDHIEAGDYDFLIDEEMTTTNTNKNLPTNNEFEELDELVKEIKESLKDYEKYKPYIYAIILFIILKICGNILKKSIHKNH